MGDKLRSPLGDSIDGVFIEKTIIERAYLSTYITKRLDVDMNSALQMQEWWFSVGICGIRQ